MSSNYSFGGHDFGGHMSDTANLDDSTTLTNYNPKYNPMDTERLRFLSAKVDREAAETHKAEAEAAAAKALAGRSTAETRLAELSARVAQIQVDREEYNRKQELALNTYNHVYVYNGPIVAQPILTALGPSQTVQDCINQLTIWDRSDPGCPIDIVFNSPGGDVIAGMALFDFIKFLRSKGHFITTIALGMAASMAGILLQAGDKRVMGREAWLLIHQGGFSVEGTYGEMIDTMKWVSKIQDRILDIFATRTTEVGGMTRATIKSHWQRKDWWIDSDSALKWGLIDAIQ